MTQVCSFSYDEIKHPALHRFLSQEWERGKRSAALAREMEAHFSGNRVPEPEPENDNGRLERIEMLLERIETRIYEGKVSLVVEPHGEVKLPADVLENLDVFV